MKLNTNLSIVFKGPSKSIETDMKKGQWHLYRESTNFLKSL